MIELELDPTKLKVNFLRVLVFIRTDFLKNHGSTFNKTSFGTILARIGQIL